jgi:hypothetical protein
MLTRFRTFSQDHWRGRVALLPTCLITLLALRLLLGGLGTARPIGWPFAFAAGVSLASASVLIWQLVGGVRAVARAGHDLVASVAGSLVLLATAALFLGAELSHWSARGELPLVLPDPPQPMTVTDGTARITGAISYATLKRLDMTLPLHPELRRIELESDGGHIPAARALAGRIEKAGLDTRATGLCASACTLVFMAGQNRSLAPGAGLGFHAYSLLRNDPMHSTAEEEARDRSYLARRGVSQQFIARAFATPPDRLWRPSPDALRAAGLLTN